MSIFISFSSKDRKYVSEFLLEAKNQGVPAWSAMKREASTGKDFIKLINTKINKSSGAIVLISESSLTSKFINEIEIPNIINRSQKVRNYKIIPILVDDTDIKDHKILAKNELLNSRSTSLESLSGRQYELMIKESISEFGYAKRKRLMKLLLIAVVTSLILFILASNVQDVLRDEPTQVINVEEFEDVSESFDNEAFIQLIRSDEIEKSIAKGSLITDQDFLSMGEWVCEKLSVGIPNYMVYDIISFKARRILLELGLTGGIGGDVPPESMDALINSIFDTSNEMACSNTVETSFIIEKVILMEYLANNYVYRSESMNSLFKDDYLSVYYELDTNDQLDEWTVSTIFFIDNTLEYIISICEYDLSDTDSFLENMQILFQESKTLEEQNTLMDTMEIQYTIIPQLFCPEKEDDGLFLNTAFYFMEYNFEPVFTP
jgi:hypothetical protein